MAKVPQESNNTACPRCKGRGTELVPESGSSFGRDFANPGNRMKEVTCGLCRGNGKKRS